MKIHGTALFGKIKVMMSSPENEKLKEQDFFYE